MLSSSSGFGVFAVLRLFPKTSESSSLVVSQTSKCNAVRFVHFFWHEVTQYDHTSLALWGFLSMDRQLRDLSGEGSLCIGERWYMSQQTDSGAVLRGGGVYSHGTAQGGNTPKALVSNSVFNKAKLHSSSTPLQNVIFKINRPGEADQHQSLMCRMSAGLGCTLSIAGLRDMIDQKCKGVDSVLT